MRGAGKLERRRRQAARRSCVRVVAVAAAFRCRVKDSGAKFVALSFQHAQQIV